MAKSLPPLTWFRSFEAAARHLSFTTAAAEIGLTQSAVSQQVKSLEMRLRVPLFVRHARGLALTDEGRRLLPQVGAALETLSLAAGSLSDEAGPELLTIATSVSVAQWLIAPRLPDFSVRFPHVRARFISAIWPDDFHTGRADVEIRFGSEKQVGKDAVALRPNRLVALKSPHLGGDLEALPLIEAVGTSGGWQAWSDVYGGLTRPAFYVDNYGMALQLAANGNGVALVSEVLADHAMAEGSVIKAHPGAIPGQEGYYLWSSERNPVASDFSDWFLEKISV